MTTRSIPLPIGGALPPDGSASNAAPAIQKVKSSAGAPTPYFLQAAFDATTDEILNWGPFRMPGDYVGTLAMVIHYKMASATSGSVRFEGYVAAVTPGDSEDVDAVAFGSSNSNGGTVPGTAGYLGSITITLTNADGLAAGDFVVVRLNRDADGSTGTDDATGDAEVVSVTLTYSDV